MKLTKKKIIILIAMIVLIATISIFVITKPKQNKTTIKEVKLNQIKDEEILEDTNEEQNKDEDEKEEVAEDKVEETTSDNQENKNTSNSDVNKKQEQSNKQTTTNSNSQTKNDSSNQQSSSNNSSSNKSNNKDTSNNATNNTTTTNSNQTSGVTNNNSNSQANQKEEVKPNNDKSINTSHLDYSTHKGRIDCTDYNKCIDDSLKIYFKYKQCISNVFYVEVMANNGTILGYFTEYVFKESSYSTYDECQKVGNEIKGLLSDRVTGYQCDSSNKLKINTDY